MAVKPHLKEQALTLIQALVDDQVVTPQDIARFATSTGDLTDPEYLRQDMENWYRTLGIEAVTGQRFTLKKPFFTHQELVEAYEQQEMIVCVPQGITRQQLAKLFNLSSWACDDELVTRTTETEDFWFKTRCSLVPDHLDKTGTEIRRIFEREGKLGMSLERYMAFVARTRYLTGKTPDLKYWVWLTRGRYDGKGMLIAGFDSSCKFSVHGWLPSFHAPLCGSRYVAIPDHLYV
jgi:hypothetical protein